MTPGKAMTPAKALAERLEEIIAYYENYPPHDGGNWRIPCASAIVAFFREQRPTRERLQDIAANEIPNGPMDSHEIRVRAGFIADAILALWDAKEREGE